MKKKFISIVLCLALSLSLAPSALALGAFADVTDAETAQNVEVLRLMGVIEGDDNGAFRPGSSLTRAEFCKMAVVLMGNGGAVARYSRSMRFDDLRKHWAVGYVNFAASEEGGRLIHGLPDGTFAPDRAITFGEAVTILTRLLGYQDKDTGGVWPDGYIALAGEAGMTKGVAASGNASITRAQAAKLFVNALSSKNSKGVTLLARLGYTADLTKDTVTLWSIDTAKGVMHTSDGDPDMENPLDGSALIGLKGWVVKKDNKAVTFLPATSTSGSAVSDAAVIVSANGSTAGFDALTGGATNYTVYRNGVRASAGALKRGDVVTYNAANNTIQACDTRIAVYYENCEPSPAAPTKITVLGGTVFKVLPSAQQSLSQYKPGKTLTLLLTADGKVAGAAENGGNAFAYVTDKGVFLICGGSIEKKLELKASDAAVATSKVLGEVVRVSQSGKNASQIYLSKQSGSTGVLDLTAKTLGTRKLADGALVFSEGKLTTLASLGVSRVEQNRIAYARTNSANEVDLIVIKDSAGAVYGRVNDSGPYHVGDVEAAHSISVRYPENGTEKSTAEYASGFDCRNGDYVEAVIRDGKLTSITHLTKLSSVPASAWIGDTAVNYGGQTYIVYPDSVICWNKDAGKWFDDLAAAKAYGGKMDLYVKDGVVRAIEVRS